jgi:hypothetical protein
MTAGKTGPEVRYPIEEEEIIWDGRRPKGPSTWTPPPPYNATTSPPEVFASTTCDIAYAGKAPMITGGRRRVETTA